MHHAHLVHVIGQKLQKQKRNLLNKKHFKWNKKNAIGNVHKMRQPLRGFYFIIEILHNLQYLQ